MIAFSVNPDTIATTRLALVAQLGGDPTVDDVDDEAIIAHWRREGRGARKRCAVCACFAVGAVADFGGRRWHHACFECALHILAPASESGRAAHGARTAVVDMEGSPVMVDLMGDLDAALDGNARRAERATTTLEVAGVASIGHLQIADATRDAADGTWFVEVRVDDGASIANIALGVGQLDALIATLLETRASMG